MRPKTECSEAEIYLTVITLGTACIPRTASAVDRCIPWLTTDGEHFREELTKLTAYLNAGDHMMIEFRWHCGVHISLSLHRNSEGNISVTHLIKRPEYFAIGYPYPEELVDISTYITRRLLPQRVEHEAATRMLVEWCEESRTKGPFPGWVYPGRVTEFGMTLMGSLYIERIHPHSQDPGVN